MGLNFRKAAKADSAAAPAPSNTPTVGRERLRHFEENLARGRACVTAMEARCAQLSKIITDAVAADQALQLFISGDTGVSALAAHAAGETTPDEEVAKLIALQKCTAEGATAAKAAVPAAEAALENARSQIIALDGEKVGEIKRVVMQLADHHLAVAYRAAFAKTARLHDELLGFARAVQGNIGEIALIEDEMTAPRFALSSLNRADGAYDPYMRHFANDFVVGESTKVWQAVKARLEEDVDADLSDLIATED